MPKMTCEFHFGDSLHGTEEKYFQNLNLLCTINTSAETNNDSSPLEFAGPLQSWITFSCMT